LTVSVKTLITLDLQCVFTFLNHAIRFLRTLIATALQPSVFNYSAAAATTSRKIALSLKTVNSEASKLKPLLTAV